MLHLKLVFCDEHFLNVLRLYCTLHSILMSMQSIVFTKMLYDKVNRTCITFNVFFLNAYIMIPNHTGSALSTHTTLFGWVILITMMSLNPRLRSCL